MLETNQVRGKNFPVLSSTVVFFPVDNHHGLEVFIVIIIFFVNTQTFQNLIFWDSNSVGLG